MTKAELEAIEEAKQVLAAFMGGSLYGRVDAAAKMALYLGISSNEALTFLTKHENRLNRILAKYRSCK